MNIGLLGTGNLGSLIVRRLLDQGHTLYIWNRSPKKTVSLSSLGAKLVPSPAKLVSKSDFIITCLTDSTAIDSVFDREDGVYSADLTGKVFIEMSTVTSETQIALYNKIKSLGGYKVECTHTGSAVRQLNGELYGFVAGDEESFNKATPVLNALCRRIEYVGSPGTASKIKLAINLMYFSLLQALAEGLAINATSDVPPERLMEMLMDASVFSGFMKSRYPFITESLRGKKLKISHYNIAAIQKDMDTLSKEAELQGFDLPIAKTMLQYFNKALDQGLGSLDAAEAPSAFLEQLKK